MRIVPGIYQNRMPEKEEEEEVDAWNKNKQPDDIIVFKIADEIH